MPLVHGPGTAAQFQPPHPWLLRGFRRIARRRIRAAFRALRLANADALQRAGIDPETAPLVIYMNHPSWWDPLVGFVVLEHLAGQRPFYAPMDAEALRRYRLLRRLGMFPVEMDTPRGAAQFLLTCDAVLDSGYILGVTPQGRFTDVRERPITLRPGLAALLARRAARGVDTVVLPLAIEYTFWDQRLPEILGLLGEPFWIHGRANASGLQAELPARLSEAQDRLARLAFRREPTAFTTVLDGAQGVAGWYSLWERLRAFRGGKEPRGDHQVRTQHDTSVRR